MKLLDLFCGAGGSAVGYSRAGFDDITGIDLKPQPNYPFRFIQGDAVEYLVDYGYKYDFIHASPPCQAYSIGAILRGSAHKHPQYVDLVREILKVLEKPYVIENVPGAPIEKTTMLCGTMFGLKLIRHRHFEIYPYTLVLTPPCNHDGTVPNGDFVTVAGHGGDNKAGNYSLESWSDAMGIYWMTRKEELAEAVPPAYTEYIATHILKYVKFPRIFDEAIQEQR